MADEVKISLVGENRRVKRTLSDTERAFRSHSTRVKSLFGKTYDVPLLGKMGRGIAGFTKSLAAPITALAGGAGVLAAGKGLVEYKKQLSMLVIQAGLARSEIAKLDNEVMNAAFASRQPRSDILSGLDIITEQTGNLELARDIIVDIGRASTASGAEVRSMAALANQLYEKLNISKDEIKSALNLLTVQGKSGSYTLGNMADNAERLFAAAGRFDMQGIEDLRKFGALIQMAQMGIGNPERTTTAIETMVADILAKQKEIGKLKIGGKRLEIYSDKDKTKLKAIDEIIQSIIVATKGREDLLGKIFGQTSIKAITELSSLYRSTGGFSFFQELQHADVGREGEVDKDFEARTKDVDKKIQQLRNLVTTFGDGLVGGVLGSMGKSLDDMTDEKKLADFRKEVQELGKDLGDIGENAWEVVRAINELMPLFKIIGFVAKGIGGLVGMVLNPITKAVDMVSKSVDVNMHYLKRGDIKGLAGRYAKEFKKDVDFAARGWGTPVASRSFAEDFAAVAGKGNSADSTSFHNHTDVNITIDSNGRAFADTTSDHGTARTHIRKLDRGIHPIVEFSR